MIDAFSVDVVAAKIPKPIDENKTLDLFELLNSRIFYTRLPLLAGISPICILSVHTNLNTYYRQGIKDITGCRDTLERGTWSLEIGTLVLEVTYWM